MQISLFALSIVNLRNLAPRNRDKLLFFIRKICQILFSNVYSYFLHGMTAEHCIKFRRSKSRLIGIQADLFG